MLEYAEASPFDKTKSHAYNSAPVLYLGFDVANNISNANVASGTFFYNTNTDIITFDKTIKVANFYSVMVNWLRLLMQLPMDAPK